MQSYAKALHLGAYGGPMARVQPPQLGSASAAPTVDGGAGRRVGDAAVAGPPVFGRRRGIDRDLGREVLQVRVGEIHAHAK